MSFTDEMKKIGENISASYDARIGTIGDIFKDTQSTLRDARATVKNFHGERVHMSEELRSELDHFRKELLDTTRKMINGFAKEHKEMAGELRDELDKYHHMIHNSTHRVLNEFRSAFEKMSQELRNMLSSYYNGEIQKPVQSMLSKFHSQMNVLAGEFRQAHNAWVNISRSMTAKRGKKQIPAKIAGKKEQICSVLQSHPEGMTMGQISKEMDCSSQSISSAFNSLKKERQISKKKNKFFFKG